MKNINGVDIAPAQMIGGMRVKQPDASRNMLIKKDKDAVMTNDVSEDKKEDFEKNQNEMNFEDERLRLRALKEKQAQDMHAHTPSRQHDITKNAGNNVRQNFTHPTQPRSMNH